MKVFSLNVNKTKFITVSTFPSTIPNINFIELNDRNCSTTINCYRFIHVQRIDCGKYLELKMDQLKLNKHIEIVNSNIRKTIYKFV